MAETREQLLARWERGGLIDPDCAGCKPTYEAADPHHDGGNPSHKASQFCKSGKKPHCTCDTCY